jgi:hypothetical protein
MTIELDNSTVERKYKRDEGFEIYITATSTSQDEALFLINQVKACIDEINRNAFKGPTASRCC